ncbi:P-loop containing nucleoside triphosphate hydrolase protein [Mycena rebaudengoi]|nr:P-loop containing nucleoside triphosphate hydrolase protein [Mycena rebaudengoi]
MLPKDNNLQTATNYIYGGQGGSGGEGRTHGTGGAGGPGQGPTVNYNIRTQHFALNNQYARPAMEQAYQIVHHCPPPSRIFQGRKKILDKMHQYFKQDPGKQHIYVLYGLGGAGKTQITLKFIQESCHFTDPVLVDAGTSETIDMGLRNIAAAKNIGNSSKDALKWLSTNHEEWLLFFDNADDPSINFNKFFPKCNHGNIVITTRNPNLRVYGAHSHVSDMEESDAVVLLLESSALELSDANQLMAAEIVQELWYLPLAIVQAGAFILECGALDTYLALYKENQAQLLSEKPAQTHDEYAWTVYTTWQISFNRLSLPAAMFLQLCSFLHRDGISEEIFSRAVEYCFPALGPSGDELQRPLEFLSHFLGPSGKWDSLRFIKLTNEIKAYSLINFDPERKIFSIHPLVHSWCQTITIDQEGHHSCMSVILGLCIKGIPQEDRQLASLRLISHVHSVMQAAQPVVTEFAAQFGNMYSFAGQYQNAKKLWAAVVEQRRILLGEDHPITFDAMRNLAHTYERLNQFKEAEELQLVLLERQRKLQGDDHLDTLLTAIDLASTYWGLGQYMEAEKLEVMVLEKRRNSLGNDNLATVHAMHCLGSTYSSLGQFNKAEELQIAVLEKRRMLLGDDHPDTVCVLHNLAMTYHNLGRYEEAKKLQVAVLEKRRKLLGDDHPNTLDAGNNLAITYHSFGQFQQAEELHVVVLEKRRKLLGDSHPRTLRSMRNLAKTYRSLDKLRNAGELEKLIQDIQAQSEVPGKETSEGSDTK